jgi:ATP phosphoribosyltransferase
LNGCSPAISPEQDEDMVSLALPTGSLEKQTLSLFQSAGLEVRRPAPRAYRATIDYPGLDHVVFYRAMEIPRLVADGTFDLGFTGADWIEESGVKVETVHTFDYSKNTGAGWRVVLAVAEDNPARTASELPAGVRIATEYPNLARDYFHQIGVPAEVVQSHGATEAKIPELADAVLEVVETGSSLKQNGLRVLTTVRRCGVRLIANEAVWADAEARAVIESMVLLMRAALAGPEHRLLTVLTPAERWPSVRPLLPGRWWETSGGPDAELVAVQAVVAETGLAALIAELASAGAVEIVESPVAKLVSH